MLHFVINNVVNVGADKYGQKVSFPLVLQVCKCRMKYPNIEHMWGSSSCNWYSE